MKSYTYILFVLLSLTACSDSFLDKTDPGQITDDKYWTSEKDVLYATYGIYDVLQRNAMYGGGPYNPGFRDHDCLSDNSLNFWDWNGLGLLAEGTINKDHWFLLDYWSDNYAGIARANNVIENVPAMSVLDEAVKNSYLAEARFLRALFYFNLVNTFGDVPLLLEPITVNESHVPKSSKEEITHEIIEDLLFAAQNTNVDDFGRADKGAVLGLLTRVYLYNKQYELAATTASEVMGMGYDLYPDYPSLFTEANEQSNEIVFSVLFQSLSEGEGEKFSGTWAKSPQTHHQPLPNLINDYYCIDGLPIGQSPLYDASDEIANRDLRLNASILFPGQIWIEGGKPLASNIPKTGYMMKKYIRNTILFNTDGPQDFYLIRYADILLMRAEALIETNNLTQEVYDLINAVRQRAGMPKIEDVEGSGLSQEALRNILRHERRVEFALEGLHYYDLKRWGTLKEAMERAANDEISVTYKPVFEGEKSYYWPIPQAEVDANRELDQNPLWK